MADQLERIVSLLPRLRAAGVVRFRCGDVQIDLLPDGLEPAGPRAKREVNLSPMDDPDTFGGDMPRYPRDGEEDE